MGKWWFVQVDNWSLHRVRPRRWMPQGTAHFRVAMGDRVYHLTSEWWVGIWLSAITWRGDCPRARSGARVSVVRPNVKRKDAAAAAGGDAQHVARMECETFKDLMPLVEHCAIVRYEDKSQRVPGWFTVKTLGAAWVVQIKDPDSGNSFQFVAESIDKALEGAALLLACDDAPWQPDAFLKAQKRK